MLCEGLAARGYVVISPDHPGDTLADWLLGAAVDDRDQRDATRRRHALRARRRARRRDRARRSRRRSTTRRIAVAGHSYGAFTALALAGSEPTDPRVRAVAGLAVAHAHAVPRARSARIDVPTMLIVGMQDKTHAARGRRRPRVRRLERGTHARVDIEDAGHQACSDVGLYLELAPQVDGLPEIVFDFVQSMAADVTGSAGDPWRPTVGLHLRILGVVARRRLRPRAQTGRATSTPPGGCTGSRCDPTRRGPDSPGPASRYGRNTTLIACELPRSIAVSTAAR